MQGIVGALMVVVALFSVNASSVMGISLQAVQKS